MPLTDHDIDRIADAVVKRLQGFKPEAKPAQPGSFMDRLNKAKADLDKKYGGNRK